MNTSTRSLIDRLMIKILHRNKDNNDVDDVEVLAYLNEATREIHRWFAMYLPNFIKVSHETELPRGVESLLLPVPFSIISDVRLDGRGIPMHSPMLPPYRKIVSWGTTGFDTVRLFNLQGEDRHHVEVEYLPAEIKELVVLKVGETLQRNESEVSLFPQIWDDSIIGHAHISYASARGMISSDEAAQRQKWTQQVMILFNDNREPTSIGEYYQGYAPRGDYN